MAKERSEKSKYKSPSSGEYCTAAQWLAETMCFRMAEKNNEGSLAHKFWNTKKWKKTYSWQVVCANRLIKKFGERTVISYIKKNKWIPSLGIKTLPDKLKKHKWFVDKEIEQEKKSLEKVEKPKEAETDASNVKRKNKSVFSRLK
jgi:hypothetical protein